MAHYPFDSSNEVRQQSGDHSPQAWPVEQPPGPAARVLSQAPDSASDAVAEAGFADDLARFHRSLARLCRSSIPLPEALQLAHAELERPSLRDQVRGLAEDVKSGQTLVEAYAARAEVFPTAYCALIEAGIASGDLPGALDRIARHAAVRAGVTDRLRRALAYPLVAAAFVLVLGGVAFIWGGFHLAYYQASIDAVPTAEWASVPSFWQRNAIPLVASVGLAVLMVATLVFAWLRSPLDGGSGPRGLGFRMPVIGRIRMLTAKEAFASTLAMLLYRQVPLPRALRLTAASLGDRSAVGTRVAVMADAAEQGAPFAEAIAAGDLIGADVAWLAEATTGGPAAAVALDDIGKVYRVRLDRAVERLCVLVVPVAELVVGLTVLAFAVSHLIASFEMISWITRS